MRTWDVGSLAVELDLLELLQRADFTAAAVRQSGALDLDVLHAAFKAVPDVLKPNRRRVHFSSEIDVVTAMKEKKLFHKFLSHNPRTSFQKLRMMTRTLTREISETNPHQQTWVATWGRGQNFTCNIVEMFDWKGEGVNVLLVTRKQKRSPTLEHLLNL